MLTLGCWQGGDTAPPVAPVVGVNSSELSCGWGRCCWHKMEVSLFPVTRVHLQHTVLCPMWVLEHIAGASTSWSKSFEPTCPFLHTSWGPLFTPLALVLFVSHHCYSLPLLLCLGYPISPCQVSKKKKSLGTSWKFTKILPSHLQDLHPTPTKCQFGLPALSSANIFVAAIVFIDYITFHESFHLWNYGACGFGYWSRFNLKLSERIIIS